MGGKRYAMRPGTPGDGPAILSVHRRSILALGRATYSEAEVESWAAGLVAERYSTAMAEDGEAFLLAADEAGSVIGFCSYKDDEVRGLYVDPAWARSGIGGALLRRAEEDIAAAGHRAFRVRASLSGRPFYAARGYRVVGHGDWKTRGGLEISVVDMEKRVG